MSALEDPFKPVADASTRDLATDEHEALTRLLATATRTAACFDATVPAIARLHGFDLLEQPVVASLAALPGELVPARSTLPLRRAQVGREVLLMFACGDPRQPVIVGVVEPRPLQPDTPGAGARAEARLDGERQVIEAEREVVLRCGEASITLTRAGKVLIKGTYILSRSTGHNRIKGAAIDLN